MASCATALPAPVRASPWGEEEGDVAWRVRSAGNTVHAAIDADMDGDRFDRVVGENPLYQLGSGDRDFGTALG